MSDGLDRLVARVAGRARDRRGATASTGTRSIAALRAHRGGAARRARAAALPARRRGLALAASAWRRRRRSSRCSRARTREPLERRGRDVGRSRAREASSAMEGRRAGARRRKGRPPVACRASARRRRRGARRAGDHRAPGQADADRSSEGSKIDGDARARRAVLALERGRSRRRSSPWRRRGLRGRRRRSRVAVARHAPARRARWASTWWSISSEGVVSLGDAPRVGSTLGAAGHGAGPRRVHGGRRRGDARADARSRRRASAAAAPRSASSLQAPNRRAGHRRAPRAPKAEQAGRESRPAAASAPTACVERAAGRSAAAASRAPRGRHRLGRPRLPGRAAAGRQRDGRGEHHRAPRARDDGSGHAPRASIRPVAPDVNACAAQAIYRARFGHGGTVAIPIDFTFLRQLRDGVRLAGSDEPELDAHPSPSRDQRTTPGSAKAVFCPGSVT